MKKLSYLTALVVILALITVCSQTEGPTSPEAILSLQKSLFKTRIIDIISGMRSSYQFLGFDRLVSKLWFYCR